MKIRKALDKYLQMQYKMEDGFYLKDHILCQQSKCG